MLFSLIFLTMICLSSISIAKPVYIKCEYEGFSYCEKNSDCVPPYNAKKSFQLKGYIKEGDFYFNGVEDYVIYNNKLYYAEYFNLESQEKESILEEHENKKDSKFFKYEAENNSTYEYFAITLKSLSIPLNKGYNFYEYIYVNRINGKYDYVSQQDSSNKDTNNSDYRIGRCEPIKYKRQF